LGVASAAEAAFLLEADAARVNSCPSRFANDGARKSLCLAKTSGRGARAADGLSPLQGLRLSWVVYPRLAPWAAFFRRFAAVEECRSCGPNSRSLHCAVAFAPAPVGVRRQMYALGNPHVSQRARDMGHRRSTEGARLTSFPIWFQTSSPISPWRRGLSVRLRSRPCRCQRCFPANG